MVGTVSPMRGRRSRSAAVIAAFGLAAAAFSMNGCAQHGRTPEVPVPPTEAATSVAGATSTSSRTSTTSTTVDPGTLPQTSQLPSATDPAFQQRMSDLWSAIVSGQPATAAAAFFPLGAYLQVKAISDPEHDYRTRLIADFGQDIMTLHDQVSGQATFESVSVPDAAKWILPGVEYNKGSYWRVYATRVTYRLHGQTRSFTIASMISWRGEWYVVHLLSIR